MTAAQVTWPEVSIPIVGMLFIGSIVVVMIWQTFATWRARMSVMREEAYQRLADEAIQAQRRTAEELTKAVAELTELRKRTSEMERQVAHLNPH